MSLEEIIAETLAEHRPLWTDGACECGASLPVEGHVPIEVWQSSVWAHQAEMIAARVRALESVPSEGEKNESE